MSNPTIRELFSALQKSMVADASLSHVLNHPDDKGDNAEINWLTWFNEYLPKRYKAAKATIIDSQGNLSDQIDAVLYDDQYSYLAFNQNGILYLPAESVYAVFEVKQDISKNNMEYAGAKAESVRKLHRTSTTIPHAGGTFPPKEPQRIIAGVLSTISSWNPPLGDAFKSCLGRYNEQQQIDCGCILKSGAFHYDYNSRILTTSSPEESLVFFFLKLLTMLQSIGTVPAINLDEYMKALSITEVLNG